MIERTKASDTISIFVGTNSIEESNNFLRRLWGLFDQEVKNAWCFFPFTDTNKNLISIGHNNVCDISFDYKKKGCINNLFISDYSMPREKIISIVEMAKCKDSSTDYYAEFIFSNNDPDLKFSHQCSDGVLVTEREGSTVIGIYIKAYSTLDLEFWLCQKRFAIQFILFSYTHILFKFKKVLYSANGSLIDTGIRNYNYDWCDSDECPQNASGEYLLPKEFFMLISSICNSDFYDRFTSAVVNASQLLFNAAQIRDLSIRGDLMMLGRTGLFDLVNASIVSSLEALLSANHLNVERCATCGQPANSIVNRIHALAKQYLNDALAERIKKTVYNNRSKFLHEGKTLTPLYYTGSCFPLIDPTNPREILKAETPLEFNLIDYCTYIVRRFVYDYYNNQQVNKENK